MALYGKDEQEQIESSKPYLCNPFDLLNLISKGYAYEILKNHDGCFYAEFGTSKKGRKYIDNVFYCLDDDTPEDVKYCKLKIDGLYVIMNYLAMSKNTLIEAQMINRLLKKIPSIAIVSLLEDLLENYRSFTTYAKADKAVLFEDSRVVNMQKFLKLSNKEVFDIIDRLKLISEKTDDDEIENYLNLFVSGGTDE
jgi:hypothetical protein